MIDIIPVRALQDNYIWLLIFERSRTAWVVDPGEAAPVLAACQDRGLKPAGILVTHHHADHTGGIGDLLRQYPDLPVYGGVHSTVPYLTHRLSDGESLPAGLPGFRAVLIPGHTLDHTAYVGDGVVFTGDTLFSAGCGRVFEGTPAMMYESLQKLTALPDQTALFCGHEYTRANLAFAATVEPDNADIQRVWARLGDASCTLPSTIAQEKQINPFLRCAEPLVRQAAERHAGRRLSDPVAVFAVLRAWKNQF